MNLHKMKIKFYRAKNQFAEKHPDLRFIFFFLKHFHNKETYKELFDTHIGYPVPLLLNHYGDLHKDKNILFVNIKADSMGFCAYLRFALSILYEADVLKLVPVVKFEDESGSYQEKDPINGTTNFFEYFFMQPSGISLKELNSCYHVFSYKSFGSLIACAENDLGNDALDYVVQESYLAELGKIYKKYIILNDTTKSYIDDGLKKLFGLHTEKILGVHIRGTDFNLHWEGHPNVVTLADYIEAVDEGLRIGSFNRIFLATDDDNMLTEFKNHYGDKLIYYNDIHRGSGKMNIAFEKVERENGHYLNGLEVLRDMYTLAKCDGLVAGFSQVSICARIVRKSLGIDFDYQNILFNGIYHVK